MRTNSLFFLFLLLITCFTQHRSSEKSSGYFYAMRFPPGDDIFYQINLWTRTNNVTAASIVSATGSIQKGSLRFANQPTPHVFDGFHEIVSLSGTISLHGSHIHMSVSESTGKTIGGHLTQGNIVYTTVELVMAVFPEVEFERRPCNVYGYRELFVKRK